MLICHYYLDLFVSLPIRTVRNGPAWLATSPPRPAFHSRRSVRQLTAKGSELPYFIVLNILDCTQGLCVNTASSRRAYAGNARRGTGKGKARANLYFLLLLVRLVVGAGMRMKDSLKQPCRI